MSIDNLPQFVRDHHEIHEWKHASAILENDFPDEWNDIIEVLRRFRLKRSQMLTPGGGKSPISQSLDSEFRKRRWQEKGFETKIVVEKTTITRLNDCMARKRT